MVLRNMSRPALKNYLQMVAIEAFPAVIKAAVRLGNRAEDYSLYVYKDRWTIEPDDRLRDPGILTGAPLTGYASVQDLLATLNDALAD